MFHYIRTAVLNPKELYIVRNMKGRRFFSYYTFLVLILTFSLLGGLIPLLQQVNEDSREIATHIPEFVIENSSLQTDEESFVYQTNTILFFFDPDAKIAIDTIDQNTARLSASIAIGLLEHELYLNFDGIGRSLSYNQLDGVNQNFLRSLFEEFSSFSFLTLLMLFAASYIGVFLQTIMEMILLFLFANIISILLQSKLRFAQSARIAMVASTLPILLLGITSIAQFNNPYHYEMRIVFSLILFGLSVTEMKNRRQQELQQRKKEMEEKKKDN